MGVFREGFLEEVTSKLSLEDREGWGGRWTWEVLWEQEERCATGWQAAPGVPVWTFESTPACMDLEMPGTGPTQPVLLSV